MKYVKTLFYGYIIENKIVIVGDIWWRSTTFPSWSSRSVSHQSSGRRLRLARSVTLFFLFRLEEQWTIFKLDVFKVRNVAFSRSQQTLLSSFYFNYLYSDDKGISRINVRNPNMALKSGPWARPHQYQGKFCHYLILITT